MPQILDIPTEIRGLLEHQIDIEKNYMDKIVEKIQQDSENGTLDDGIVPRDGDEFSNQVRAIRETALGRFRTIKIWFGDIICWNMIADHRSPGADEIQQVKERLNTAYADKKRAIEDRKKADEEVRFRTNYDKYILYKDEFNEMEKENHKKALRGLAFGIVITCIFAAVDFFMLRTMFINSNFSYVEAQLYAVLCAVALDLPPYLLGFVSAKKTDYINYFEIMDLSTSRIAKRTIVGWNISKWILTIVVTIFLTVYLFMCILTFLGGGDFNLSFHALAETLGEGNSTLLENVEFRGVDMLSSFIPLATSACAGAVGILLQPSKSDLFKKFLLKIDDKMIQQTQDCENAIIETDTRIDNLKKELSILKYTLWGRYGFGSSMPINEGEFFSKITETFRKEFIPSYKNIYESCCRLLRDEVLTYLDSINMRLAEYSGSTGTIRNMKISTDEQEILNEIWNDGKSDSLQGDVTQRHLKQIDEIEKIFGSIHS